MRLTMEFKDLPKEIQSIAATTLSDSLVEINPAYIKKETIDNLVRNVRDAFTGLYSVSVTNNQNTEEAAKRNASVTGFHVEEKYSKKNSGKLQKNCRARTVISCGKSVLSMRKVIQMTQD
ncbi:conserved hypothetical protein, partial [Escherichia coli TA280]